MGAHAFQMLLRRRRSHGRQAGMAGTLAPTAEDIKSKHPRKGSSWERRGEGHSSRFRITTRMLLPNRNAGTAAVVASQINASPKTQIDCPPPHERGRLSPHANSLFSAFILLRALLHCFVCAYTASKYTTYYVQALVVLVRTVVCNVLGFFVCGAGCGCWESTTTVENKGQE